MLEHQYFRVRPMKVKCDVRYLFAEPLYGVAPDPPGCGTSTLKVLSQ